MHIIFCTVLLLLLVWLYLEVLVGVRCELGAVHVQTAQTLHGWKKQTRHNINGFIFKYTFIPGVTFCPPASLSACNGTVITICL